MRGWIERERGGGRERRERVREAKAGREQGRGKVAGGEREGYRREGKEGSGGGEREGERVIADEDLDSGPNIGMKYKSDFIENVGKVDDRFIMILDIDKIFEHDELFFEEDVESGVINLMND